MYRNEKYGPIKKTCFGSRLAPEYWLSNRAGFAPQEIVQNRVVPRMRMTRIPRMRKRATKMTNPLRMRTMMRLKKDR